MHKINKLQMGGFPSLRPKNTNLSIYNTMLQDYASRNTPTSSNMASGAWYTTSGKTGNTCTSGNCGFGNNGIFDYGLSDMYDSNKSTENYLSIVSTPTKTASNATNNTGSGLTSQLGGTMSSIYNSGKQSLLKAGKTVGTGILGKGKTLLAGLKSVNGISSVGGLANTAINALVKDHAQDKASRMISGGLNIAGTALTYVNPILGTVVKGLATATDLIGPKVKGNSAKELTDKSSSYTGNTAYDSMKFGLAGYGAGHKYANTVAIREGDRTQSEDILQRANQDSLASAGSMQDFANKYNQQLSGNWQQTNGIHFGKEGAKMQYDLSFAHQVLSKYQNGGTFEEWYKTVPKEANDTVHYNLRRAYEVLPKKQLEKWRTATPKQRKSEKFHLPSIWYDESSDTYEFLKRKDHPTIDKELEWYNSKIIPEAIEFRNNYNLDTTKDYYRYVPKNTVSFKSGGKLNVIPEGALHAYKNNMSSDTLDGNITKKGIPVIKSGGKNIEQVAEIEKNEIIFTKEITEKLEELRKKDTPEAAIEAGKILVDEILYNTEDRTGLIKTVQ